MKLVKACKPLLETVPIYTLLFLSCLLQYVMVLPSSTILFKVGLYCLQCPQLKLAMAWLSLFSTNSTLPMIFLDQTGKGRPFSSTALFSLMHCHLQRTQKLVMAWLFFSQDNLVERWKLLSMLYTKETQVKGNRGVSFPFLFLNCTVLHYGKNIPSEAGSIKELQCNTVWRVTGTEPHKDSQQLRCAAQSSSEMMD